MSVSTALPTITTTYSNSSSAAHARLVLTFSEDILAGTGSITISDGATQTYMGKDGSLRTRLIGATDTRTIDITDTSKVTISGDTVTILLDSNLSSGKSYSVQMAKGVLQDIDGNARAGLTDTTKLKFTATSAIAPSAVVDSGFTMSHDTGSSASDLITNTAAQTIAGKYSGTLAAGESIKVSLDNGGTWVDATVNAGAHTWSAAGTLTASSTVMARVTNADGVFSQAARQAYTFDTDAPAVASIEVEDADLGAGETTTVTVKFNETVTGLDLADFTVTGGALSNLASSADGKTWTATLTPTAGVASQVGHVTLKASGIADVAGNNGPASDTSDSFNYSTVQDTPTAVVTSVNLSHGNSHAGKVVTNSTTQTVTGTYSGTLAADEYVEVSLDNGATWTTATAASGHWFIPTASISSSNTLKARVTNGSTYSEPSTQEYTLDQVVPTATIALDNAALTSGQTATVTITFSEAVTGLTSDDFTVTGGTLGTPSSVDNITWTTVLTPTTNGSGQVQLKTSSVADSAGNSGPSAASSVSFTYDNPPTATVSTVAFSSDTGSSGSDLVTNVASQTITGTLSAALGSGEKVQVSFDNGGTWTDATSTDGTGWTLTGQTLSGSDTLQARVTNGATHSQSYSHSYMLDQAAPTATITLSEDALVTGETATVTITFSEAVTGLTLSDLKYSGTLSGLASNAAGTVWTATLTPSSNGSGEIRLDAASVTDTAGNSGPSATAYANFTYNATPTATIASASITETGTGGDFITNSTSQVISVTVSEALGHGEYVEVSLDNGATWNRAGSTSDTSWALSGQTISASNTLQARVTNGTTTGTAYSHSYTLDQAAPSLSSISLSDSSLRAGETATVTVVFDEAVTGLANTDFSVSGGTLGSFSTTDYITWTATLTPTASGTLTLTASAVTDTAGNLGPSANSASQSFTLTTDPGSLSSKTPDLDNSSDTYNTDAGGTAYDNITSDDTPTLTFSLASSGLTAGDYVDVLDTSDSNAILGTYTIASSALGENGGSVSVTASSALTEGTHTLVLRARDAAGNTGTQSSSPLSITIDKTIASMSGKTVGLAAGSDTGSSTTDNITNDNTPTVTVNVANTSGLAAGDLLQIIDTSNSNAVVGTHTVVASDYGSSGSDISIILSALTDGTHALALRAVDKANNIGTSGSTLSVKVDTAAPTLTSSSPSSGATGIDSGTSSITLTFSEALDAGSQTGFKITNSNDAQDYSEIVMEALSGNTATYNSATHAVTLSLSSSLQYGGHYTVAVYNAALADTAGNSLAIGTSLMNFYTETTPSAVTLSLTESTYASHSGTDNDHFTNHNTLAVSGITATYLQYKLSAGDDYWTTVTPSGSTYSITLDDGDYAAGDIQVRQYNDEGHESTSAVLSDDWTIDTEGPTGHVSTSTFPGFFGLGTGVLLSSITGSITGEFNLDEEFIEYTTDGSTWKQADSTTDSAWEIDSVAIAEGGEIGLRATDKAGNIGTNDGVAYTVYFGDGYAGNHTATSSKLLYTLYGNDTIDISGTDNTVYAGEGNDAVNIQSASTYNEVYGGTGSDTINVNGNYNTVSAGDGDDTVTISGSHNYVNGGYGADTMSVTGSANEVDAGDGVNVITIDGTSSDVTGGSDIDTIDINSSSNDVDAGDGNDVLTVDGSSNLVDAGYGDNDIRITGSDNTVNSASGTDTVVVGGSANSVYAGDGADNITVSASGNTVYGEAGDDAITVAVLGSTVDGGDGADIITVSANLGRTLSGSISGGSDSSTDTLSLGLSGQSLTLADLTSNLTHFEKISLGTSNSLTITGDAIKTMSDTDLIRFEGDSSDTIYADRSLWESATWISIVGYSKYQLKSDTSVTFIIDNDITLSWTGSSS